MALVIVILVYVEKETGNVNFAAIAALTTMINNNGNSGAVAPHKQNI